MSSVLRRAIKEFGPKHLVDEKEDTCWNSDQVFTFLNQGKICMSLRVTLPMVYNYAVSFSITKGSPQWIEVNLDSLSNIEEIQIRFQGGFAGKDCCIQMTDENNANHHIMDFYPEDVNSLQISF